MNEFKKNDSHNPKVNLSITRALCEANNQTPNMLINSASIKIQINKVKRVGKGIQTIETKGVFK